MVRKTELNEEFSNSGNSDVGNYEDRGDAGLGGAQGPQKSPERVNLPSSQSGQGSRRKGSEAHPEPHPVAIEQPTFKATATAFELLAQQPVSLFGLTQAQRNSVVVSAVIDDAGNEHVLSRFGDDVWHLSPEIQAKNKGTAQMCIRWPSDVPRALLDDAKAAVYCALRQGRRDMDWSASSAVNVGRSGAITLRHLSTLGLVNFSQIKSLHVTDHIADLKKSIGAAAISSRLYILDLVCSFEREMIHPLPEHPFGGKALSDAAGCGQEEDGPVGKTGKTPVIPPSIQKSIWERCESILAGSEALLDAREAVEMAPTNDQLILVRDAVLYQLQITSGMRNSESTGVTNGCWRAELRSLQSGQKVPLYWVRTKEIKTSGGKEMDYLVPGEIFASLEILQRYAKPLQQRLAIEAKWLEGILSSETDPQGLLSNGMKVADAVQRLHHVREIGQHMLLGMCKGTSDHLRSGSRVEVMSSDACSRALKRLTQQAGVKWDIANHQCRRTFAWNVANSRLGRMGLVFIKWQLKHASISWTQLYAANPRQDQALYQEFGDAMRESKVELLKAWQKTDARLSGGAGKQLMQTRATPARNFRQLLEATADSVNILSTGHAWCMSGTQGCHGQGIYDPSLCGGGCSQAVIDVSQSSSWQMIHLDNLRLAAITDCGPAVEAKAKRAVDVSTQVLADLGIPLPKAEQATAYEQEAWVE